MALPPLLGKLDPRQVHFRRRGNRQLTPRKAPSARRRSPIIIGRLFHRSQQEASNSRKLRPAEFSSICVIRYDPHFTVEPLVIRKLAATPVDVLPVATLCKNRYWNEAR